MSTSIGGYIAGVSLAFVATCFSAAGLILQKITHMRNDKRKGEGEAEKHCCADPYWLGGLLCMAGGSAMTIEGA